MNERIMMVQRKRKIVVDEALKFGVVWQDLMGYDRRANTVAARHSAMHRMRVELGLSYTAIGRYMGRDHSTVIGAIRKFRDQVRFVETARGWHLGCPA